MPEPKSQILLRLPPDLDRELAIASKTTGISKNELAAQCLQAGLGYFDKHGKLPMPFEASDLEKDESVIVQIVNEAVAKYKAGPDKK